MAAESTPVEIQSINFETYLARLQAARHELVLLEYMCLKGKVGEPLGDGHNRLSTADDALDVYKAIATQVNAALAELGVKL
ncbi:MAG: hypothetical protein ACTSX8_10470 [Alphaproteobacteria bacterium]